MPIEGLKPRLPHLGELRLGTKQVSERSGKEYPVSLAHWRITTKDPELATRVADLVGGEPVGWESPDGPAWEVLTETDSLDVVIPPTDYLRQDMELWARSGLVRRCDGVTASIPDGDALRTEPCVCERIREIGIDESQCAPTTRLAVMMPGVNGFGQWLLTTKSWAAAREIAGSAALLAKAQGAIPAKLRIEMRKETRQGKTNTFRLPVLVAQLDIAALTSGGKISVSVGSGLPSAPDNPLSDISDTPAALSDGAQAVQEEASRDSSYAEDWVPKNLGEVMYWAQETHGKDHTQVCGALGVESPMQWKSTPVDALSQLRKLWE